MTYWLVKPLVWILCKLPLKWLHGIGRFLGAAVWAISKERRRIATINAKIIGAENPEKVARKSFDYTFMAYMENFYAHNITDEFFNKNVTVTGIENYHEVMRLNNNYTILAGGHFGTWGLFPCLFTKIGNCKLVTIGRASKNKAIDKIMAELRTFDNIAYLTHRGALEKLPHYMNEGYLLGVYLDHTATPKDCINVPFFGYKTPTIAGIYAMAARKNLPILPMFPRFKEEGGYEIIILPAIYPDKTLKAKARIEKLATDMNGIYEQIFSKYPEQWYLIHRRFKRVEEADGTLSDRVYRS